MSRLVEGKWEAGPVATNNKKGEFDRRPRSFREFIGGENSKFKPESNRYHLYVSYACPWAHRTLIYRKLKKLEGLISVDVVSPDMLSEGWEFKTDFPGCTGDRLFNGRFLREIYLRADPKVTTSVTVPVLWDKKTETIVNNESSEIIRMFNSSFNFLTGNEEDYYPEDLRSEIDELNDKIYRAVNNGVYRCGFATTQAAYDEAVEILFSTLSDLERRLERHRFLLGDRLTEADIRLIPSLLRFDIVYFTHFKCNLRRIKDYPNLSRYTNELYALPAIKETTNFAHIKRHYYFSHEIINPYRIIPKGPEEIL